MSKWDKYKAGSDDSVAAPNSSENKWKKYSVAEEAPPVDESPGSLESLGRGALQGISLGYADEITGAIEAALTDKTYTQSRDEARASNSKAQEANPWTYGAGELGGGVATLLVPGAAGVGAGLKGAAALGAAGALGSSNADLTKGEVGGALLDTAIGGTIGAVANKVVPAAVTKIKDGAGWVGKKVGNIAFGVGEEATEKYLANPVAIRSAKPLKEVTDNFLGKVDEVGNALSRDSTESYAALYNHSAKATTLSNPVRLSASNLIQKGEIGADRKSAVRFLDTIAKDIDNMADDAGELTLDKGKQTLSVLDAEITKAEKKGVDKQILRAYSEARQNIDSYLKTRSPEYKEIMSKLAEDTQNLKGISGKFRSEGGAANTLKRVSQGRDPFTKEALQAFDDQFASNFTQDLEDAAIKNQFTRDTTNGSRRTLAGAAIGGGLGSVVVPGLGSVVGPALGASAGAAIDKVGGQIWQKVLDGTLKVGPYARVLEKAAKSGPASLNATHVFLMKNYPEYKSAVESSPED